MYQPIQNIKYIHIKIFDWFGLFSCIMDIYETNFFIMLIDFTEFELETIANAMDDYIQYDDEKLNTESLFGGLSVAERVNSIQTKIDNVINWS